MYFCIRFIERITKRYDSLELKIICFYKNIGMKRFIVFLLVLLFIAIAMVITCPEKNAHKTKVSEKLSEIFDKELKSDIKNDDDLLGATIGSAIGSKLINVLVDQNLEVESYYVCSMGKMTIDGQTSPVSIGVFNHVFLLNDFDFEDVKESFRK